MSSEKPEIQDLAQRARTLAARLERLPRLRDAAAHGGGPLEEPLAGRTLGQWLEELWPGSGGRAGAVIGEGDLDRLGRLLREKLAQSRERAAGLQASLQRLERLILDERGSLASRENLAKLLARETAARLEPVRVLYSTQKALCADSMAQWETLKAKLEAIRPQGLNRFVDARGREISQKSLTSAQRNLRKLAREAERQARLLAQRQREQAQAEREAREAHASLAAVAADKSLAESHHRAKAVRLERVRLLVKKRLAALAPLDLELRILEGLKYEHRLLLERAGKILAGFCQDDDDALQAPALPALDEALAQAAGSGERLGRLGRLMSRLDKRCARQCGQVGPALKEQRRVNREIDRLEAELSGILETLFDPDREGGPTPHRLAARLTTLCNRGRALMPQVERAHRDLNDLEQRLRTGLERGRRWQAAWKRAGKDERASLAQAEALAIDAGLQADRELKNSREFIDRLEPLVRAVTPLCSLDLAEPLGRAVDRVARRHLLGLETEARAREIKNQVPAPCNVKLSQPPMALKPLSTALRRLSGRRVEMDRLQAVMASAERFSDLTMGPIYNEIRRPLEKVALSLSASLAGMTSQRNQLAAENQRHKGRIKKLRSSLKGERQLSGQRQRLLDQARLENRGQAGFIREQEAELEITRADQALARELERELFETSALAESLARRLEHSDKLSGALKAKLLERHRLYRRSQYAVDWLDYWRDRAYESEKALESAKSELAAARREYREAKKNLALVAVERDEAQTLLARERAARSRQALDLLSSKTLSVELAASQGEAGRWAEIARNMALALAAAGQTNQERTAELRSQVDSLSAEAAMLKKQLERISSLMDGPDSAASPPRSAQKAGPGRAANRAVRLEPEQVETALERLGRARRRLSRAGRTVIGHWVVIAALTSGLVLMQPGAPSKATRTETPLLAPKPVERHLASARVYGPSFNVPATARVSQAKVAGSGLELNLMPLRATGRPLPYHLQRELKRQAQKAGLSPKVLITSARAVFAGQQAVETKALGQLAETARSLAQRHPLIFRELKNQGLPSTAPAVAALNPPAEKAQHLFLDRLYREYRTLGFTAEEALGALAANERAFASLRQGWRDPGRYRGKVRPLPMVEAMGLETFLKRSTPYIKSRLEIFLKQRGMDYAGELGAYAKNLAFDMYCAAKKFGVPLTLLMAIAHQETWYANVLGDMGKSASPFQIYEPTKELIIKSMAEAGLAPPPKKTKLERHLTMATFMAAFHLRELMQMAEVPPRLGRKSYVNLDQVMLRYNGSKHYAAKVKLRKKQLASYLRKNPG